MSPFIVIAVVLVIICAWVLASQRVKIGDLEDRLRNVDDRVRNFGDNSVDRDNEIVRVISRTHELLGIEGFDKIVNKQTLNGYVQAIKSYQEYVPEKAVQKDYRLKDKFVTRPMYHKEIDKIHDMIRNGVHIDMMNEKVKQTVDKMINDK